MTLTYDPHDGAYFFSRPAYVSQDFLSRSQALIALNYGRLEWTPSN
jgi:hypothetical protein